MIIQPAIQNIIYFIFLEILPTLYQEQCISKKYTVGPTTNKVG